ncbi:cytochrome P450 [Lichtheimia hyalospora FSU 10163]|nr:cytochrome P450 [Lichtheimia hyalospora FSU 10163]
MAVMSGMQPKDTARTITMPAAARSSHGLYLRFDHNGWAVHVTRPDAIKRVLLKTDLFLKIDTAKNFENTLTGKVVAGPNVAFLTGDRWKAQRKIANPAFKRSMPVQLFGRLSQKLIHVMDQSIDQPIEILHFVERYTLDSIAIAGLDFDFDAIGNPDSEWMQRYLRITKAIEDLPFLLFPFLDDQRFARLVPRRRRAHQDVDAFLAMIDGVIERKRASLKDAGRDLASVPQSEKDLLTLLIEAESNENGYMTNEELRSNACAFFIAGHETTSSALSTIMYYLAAHQDVQDKARQEAIRILGDEPKDEIPTLEQLKDVTYINMVIKEALRINPPGTQIIAREAQEDTELAGMFIPKGKLVAVDLYELQHSPDVWKDPEMFRPERFAPGGEAEQMAGMGLTWIPFSNGAHQCIGMNFSLAEQRVLLLMLLRKYRWCLPDDSMHKNGLVTHGFGILLPKDLKLSFEKQY